MHPALSVIIFSTLTGLGYGLANVSFIKIILSGDTPPYIFILLFMGYVAVALGLVASLFHLGHWRRAWRALSQWRTSWLSREGVLAILSFIAPFAIIILPLDDWNGYFALWGLVVNILVVWATSMIYASLKPIAAWNNPMVPVVFQICSFVSGLLAVQFLTGSDNYFMGWAILLVLLVHIGYWFVIEKIPSLSNLGTATGLNRLGSNIAVYDKPHDAENYLNKEMGFQLARTHAQTIKLIIIGLWLWAAIAVYFQKFNGNLVAFVAFMAGVFLARWLFFAEAKHVVNIYYRGKP